jgi:hypothetical protein
MKGIGEEIAERGKKDREKWTDKESDCSLKMLKMSVRPIKLHAYPFHTSTSPYTYIEMVCFYK